MKSIQNTIWLFVFAILFGCRQAGSANNQSIQIKKTDRQYSFEASYPQNKTAKLQAYLENTLKLDQLFTTADEKKDAEIGLGTARFHINAKPGYVLIQFKKQQNSENSYQKLEEMCLGIKEVLK